MRKTSKKYIYIFSNVAYFFFSRNNSPLEKIFFRYLMFFLEMKCQDGFRPLNKIK